MANIYGFDLGTCNLKFYNRHADKIVTEKNTIAVINRNQLYACGDRAYDMFEKAPDSIEVSFPVSGGMIADYDHLQALIQELLEIHARGRIRGSEFLVAVPTGITEVQKRAFHDLFAKSRLKPRAVFLCDKPVAAAAGMGLDVTGPSGSLVVDIGADTTEISVLSLGGLVLGTMLHTGGNRLDEAIAAYIRKHYNLMIGKKSASQLKESIGSASGIPARKSRVIGRDIVSGLPAQMDLDASAVCEAIKEPLSALCDEVRSILENTPPEIAKDIIRSGIYLTGGGSRLQSMDKLLSQTVSIPVNTFDEPETSVVKGLSLIAADNKFKHLAYSLNTRIFR